jgi:hypothetical protein
MTSAHLSRAALGGIVAALCLAPAAHGAVTISSAATSDMTCTSGVCTPTAANAVLNVSDLTTMLASGSVTVNTGTGSLAAQVEDIVVSAGFNWASANALTLDAYRSVTVTAPVADNGSGAVSLVTNDGGSSGYLLFVSGGSLSFLGTANSLSINGAAYTLKNSVAALASAIASKPSGSYALANNYDASKDGEYTNSPIPTTFTGNFEGLGNTISNLKVRGRDGAGKYIGGLFEEAAAGSVVENLGLSALHLDASRFMFEGGLVGEARGSLFGDHVSGIVTGDSVAVGGLAGLNFGTVANSYATATVRTEIEKGAGGLVGDNSGPITLSFSTGRVSGKAGSYAGGLVAGNQSYITNCYATGDASAGAEKEGDTPEIGGLAGYDGGAISDSYSTGSVSGGAGADVGGFEGYDMDNEFSNLYWDTTTGGTKGTGNDGNVSGLTGLTSAQLKSGLPSGFDPTIWTESPSINKGFPYLIANPPPQ